MMAEFVYMDNICMARPPITRPSLLIRLREADDVEAWDQFVGLYAPLVYGFFRRRGLQDADAADLTQDVFHGVVARVRTFDYDRQRGTFRSWLYAIARNKLRDFLAAKERQKPGNGHSLVLNMLQSLPAPEVEADQWEREWQRRVFFRAAEQIRAHVDGSTWQAFWQTAVQGKSGQEVANSLGMSVGAVYVAKSRVIARIRRIVDEIQGELT
jgi:RNA polymerase sigma-70 factor (ECF subfamily)